MKDQRNKISIGMSESEQDEFLRNQPLCRIATVREDGHPHTSALWFVWYDGTLWLNSLVRSRRWAETARDPRVSVIVDDGGLDFYRLRGVELRGTVTAIGEVPRSGEPDDTLAAVEQLFADKYMGGGEFRYDGRHAWLRLTADRAVSWDFARLRS